MLGDGERDRSTAIKVGAALDCPAFRTARRGALGCTAVVARRRRVTVLAVKGALSDTGTSAEL